MQPKEQEGPCERNVKKAVLNDLSARYSKQENYLAVASALDPRFKRLPLITEDERDNCFKTINNAIVKTFNSVQAKVEPQDENSQNC